MSAWDWIGDRAEDARDAYSGAMDFVLPGDSLRDRALSMVDGRAPLSPMAPVRSLGEAVGEAAPEALDSVAQETVPGYGTMTGVAGKVDDAVAYVPGGYVGAGAGLLILLVWATWRPAVRTGKRAAATAVKTYAPGAYAVAKGKPRPPRRPAGSHSAKERTPRSRYRCRPGRADVLVATGQRLEVCARNEVEAARSARRRWQGWTVRTTAVAPCPSYEGKVHAELVKARKR